MKKRRKKVQEPLNLWEQPIEYVKKLFEEASKFPTSRMALVYKHEMEREDRSKPQDLDHLFNHEDYQG